MKVSSGFAYLSKSHEAVPLKVYQTEKFMLSDTQVFLALFVSLITGVLAVRLGTQLYK
jgi:photosystem I reaction center subunit XII